MVDSPFLVVPGKKLNLAKLKPAQRGQFKDKQDALAASQRNLDRLKELQELLYADGHYAVLVVLQAMDAGGKDGTIEHVFSGINPQGCSVTSFKVPSDLERTHDYLWRVHQAAPRRSMIGIFNRSHYESVLVERVKKLVPKGVWSRRYEHINEFEKLLADEGTLIMKFFLHISKEEQRARLQARLEDKSKHWKFNIDDLAERERWDDYMDAYQDALQKCSSEHAPWYVIPADYKWFRNWAVADIIVRSLRTLDMKYPPAPKDLDKIVVR
jgi:PPK2 family polyphosphate:nucleotide phosphotransferase